MISPENMNFEILPDKSPLTPRQNETLFLCMQGYAWREIAKIQGVSRRTVEKSFDRARTTTGDINNITMVVSGFCDGWIVRR